MTLSTDFSYNDEETLRAARPKVLIRSLEELVPKVIEHEFIPV